MNNFSQPCQVGTSAFDPLKKGSGARSGLHYTNLASMAQKSRGTRCDSNSGARHYRNRSYSPTMMRWMQQDPVGYVDGASLYQFVANNPLNRRDPSGLFSHQHCFNAKDLAAVTAAETEARRILGLWREFLNDPKLNGDLFDHYQARYGVIDDHKWRKAGNFAKLVLANADKIENGFLGNKYGVERNANTKGLAWVYKFLISINFDDDIHFGDDYFAEPPREQAAYLLHEMSHYYANTSDDYAWTKPTRFISASVQVAQMYEEMGRKTTAEAVKKQFYTWADDTMDDILAH